MLCRRARSSRPMAGPTLPTRNVHTHFYCLNTDAQVLYKYISLRTAWLRRPGDPTRQLRLPTMASFGQRSTQHLNLPLHHRLVRPADGAPGLHTVFKVEDVLHVVVKLVTERLEVLQRKVGQGALARLCERDRAPRDMVRLPEGNLGYGQRTGAGNIC